MPVIIKYLCDKCNTEVTHETGYIHVGDREVYVLCRKCFREMAKKEQQRRADLTETLRSLWESNISGRRAVPWTVEEMAKEVGCSETMVRNCIKLFETEASA